MFESAYSLKISLLNPEFSFPNTQRNPARLAKQKYIYERIMRHHVLSYICILTHMIYNKPYIHYYSTVLVLTDQPISCIYN